MKLYTFLYHDKERIIISETHPQNLTGKDLVFDYNANGLRRFHGAYVNNVLEDNPIAVYNAKFLPKTTSIHTLSKQFKSDGYLVKQDNDKLYVFDNVKHSSFCSVIEDTLMVNNKQRRIIYDGYNHRIHHYTYPYNGPSKIIDRPTPKQLLDAMFWVLGEK